MQFRRTVSESGLVTQRKTADGGWEDTDVQPLGAPTIAPEFDRLLAERHSASAGGCLPFQPVSFRDFMLSRQHVIDASRGLIKHLHPGQAAVTSLVEAVTRRPFPMFSPHKLFDAQPIYYMSNHLAFVPSGAPVSIPSYSSALDFELELGVVLRDTLRNSTPAQAKRAIGAYVVINDFSARDVQRAEMATGLGPQKSKHFLSSMSQTATTPDEFDDLAATLSGTVAINGKVIGSVGAKDLRWTIEEAIAHASRDETLYPGELIATGTLTGGSGMETGHWLREGDVLRLELEGIGIVEHHIERRA